MHQTGKKTYIKTEQQNAEICIRQKQKTHTCKRENTYEQYASDRKKKTYMQ